MYRGVNDFIDIDMAWVSHDYLQEVTFNYGEGCWNHCNKMYRGLPNLNHVQGVKMSGNSAHIGVVCL